MGGNESRILPPPPVLLLQGGSGKAVLKWPLPRNFFLLGKRRRQPSSPRRPLGGNFQSSRQARCHIGNFSSRLRGDDPPLSPEKALSESKNNPFRSLRSSIKREPASSPYRYENLTRARSQAKLCVVLPPGTSKQTASKAGKDRSVGS